MSKKLKNTFYSLFFYQMAFNISVVVYTNTPTVSRYARRLGFYQREIIHVNQYGLPILKWILLDAQMNYNAQQLMYINSDILINPDLFKISQTMNELLRGKNVRTPLRLLIVVLTGVSSLQYCGSTRPRPLFCQ